jgi:hypothetical protein
MGAARPASQPAMVESEPPVDPPSRGSGQLGAAMSSAQPASGLPVAAMGQVPLVTPPSVPLIPSGGTLVSSATQAGNLPPAVKPVVGPYGPTGGLDGLAGQSGHVGYAGPSGYGGAGGFAGPSGSEGMGAGNAVPTYDSTGSRAGDVTDRVRIAAARPTMKIDIGRRSRLPTVVLGIFSAVGALVILWFVAIREDDSAPRASGRTTGAPAKATPAEAATPTPGKSASTPAEAAKSPGKAAEPSRQAATPPAEPAAGSAEEGPAKAAGAPAAGSAAEPPAKAAEPPAKVAEPAPPAEPAAATPAEAVKPDAAKKKPASVGLQEPHPKPAKKSRSKRASKAEPKEQTWNDDSPFMPVATPKH